MVFCRMSAKALLLNVLLEGLFTGLVSRESFYLRRVLHRRMLCIQNRLHRARLPHALDFVASMSLMDVRRQKNTALARLVFHLIDFVRKSLRLDSEWCHHCPSRHPHLVKYAAQM